MKTRVNPKSKSTSTRDVAKGKSAPKGKRAPANAQVHTPANAQANVHTNVKTYQPANPAITSLAKLLAHLRKIGPMRACDALSELRRCVGDDVTITYEVTNDAPTVLTQRGDIHPHYAHLVDKSIDRVILSAKRKEADFSSLLYRQLNGLVLSSARWQVLSIPSTSFHRNASHQFIVNNLPQYDVYEIRDGTVVTLYHYNNSWRMSSANGYDVGNYTWVSDCTYTAAIDDLAKMYPDFSFAKLNPRVCYTIGFRHTNFHPLINDPQGMWLIQACNLDIVDNVVISQNGETLPIIHRELPDIGLPTQKPLAFTIAPQDIFNRITADNESAKQSYLSMLASGTARPHYGYFLRSKDATLPDIMLPSNLLQTLQNTIYDLPRKRKQHETPITHKNRLDYVCLRAYLSVFTKFEFITMFPQFSQLYENFDVLFNKLTNRVIALTTEGPAPNVLADSKLEALARKLSEHISRSGASVQTPEGVAIVQDFMRDRRFLEVFFSTFVATA
jgi:hypothetical protein